MKAPALLLILLAAAAQAQTSAPPSATQPDVAIFANVRARELRFEVVPQVVVNVYGDVNGKPAAAVDHSERTNLPDQVQPYVTYRDIGIRLTITSTLPDIETILDEALAPEKTAPPKQPAPRSKSKR